VRSGTCFLRATRTTRRFIGASNSGAVSEFLRKVLTDLANALREEGEIDGSECFIDATFASAKGGVEEIGPTRRGKGVKIMAIVDRHGLPLSVSTYAANHDEVTLVQLSFEFYMIEAKPENLIGDRAYDSDPLDEQLRREGVEMIAPHRSNRKRKTQDGRGLPRYERRWIVERFFARIQWRRRLLVRWEYYPINFLGFVHARQRGARRSPAGTAANAGQSVPPPGATGEGRWRRQLCYIVQGALVEPVGPRSVNLQ